MVLCIHMHECPCEWASKLCPHLFICSRFMLGSQEREGLRFKGRNRRPAKLLCLTVWENKRPAKLLCLTVWENKRPAKLLCLTARLYPSKWRSIAAGNQRRQWRWSLVPLLLPNSRWEVVVNMRSMSSATEHPAICEVVVNSTINEPFTKDARASEGVSSCRMRLSHC